MKKLLLSLCLGVALLAPTAANAVTVDQLVNANNSGADYANAIECVMSPMMPADSQYAFHIATEYASSGEVKISKTPEGYLSIAGLLKGQIELVFSLSSNGTTLTSVNNTVSKRIPTYAPISGGLCANAGASYTARPCAYNMNTASSYFVSGSIQGSVQYDSYNQEYYIEIGDFGVTINGVNSYFAGIEIYVPNGDDYFNGTVKDTLKGVNRSYPIHVEFDWDYEYLSLVNFASSGYALHFSKPVIGYIGWTPIYGYDTDFYDVGAWINKTSETEGTLDFFPTQNIQGEIVNTTGMFKKLYGYELAPSNSYYAASVYGRYKINEIAHVGDSRWQKEDGGDLQTGSSTVITIDDYTFARDDHAKKLDPYYNTEISVVDDYTHSVQQAIADKGLDVSPISGEAKIKTTIYNPKNNNYVESYDLYIVPGEYRTVQDESFDFHKVKGHSLGVCLKEDIPATGDQQTIELDEFYPELKGMGLGNQSDKYTLYLKANYLQSTGLEPTFHALATQMVTTGLENIEAEEAEGEATFFNTNGVQVNNENMAPGVYIMKQGNKTTKVLVR